MERTMVIETLEEMCDLMCGGIEKDYEDDYEEIEETNKNNK